MKVFSYWDGPVTWMERLCIHSLLNTGHDLTLFTSDPGALRSSGLPCVVYDAREVLIDASLDDIRKNAVAHFTDHFRLAGLSQQRGAWVDLDLVFLKKLSQSPYLMGWEKPGSVCNAVLRLPHDSDILTDYITICAQRPLPLNMPWTPWRKALKRRIKRVTRAIQGKPAPMLLLGPDTLSFLVNKHNLQSAVQSTATYYPVLFGRTEARKFATPGYVESHITPDTVAVHLWRSSFRKIYGSECPRTGWVADRAAELL